MNIIIRATIMSTISLSCYPDVLRRHPEFQGELLVTLDSKGSGSLYERLCGKINKHVKNGEMCTLPNTSCSHD